MRINGKANDFLYNYNTNIDIETLNLLDQRISQAARRVAKSQTFLSNTPPPNFYAEGVYILVVVVHYNTLERIQMVYL